MIETAVREQGIRPGTLTLGHRQRLGVHRHARPGSCSPDSASRHRRGGYRDPESQAFIESLVPLPQGTLRLAPRVRDPRPGPGGDRRLHRPLPRPAPQPARLPHTTAKSARLGTTHKEHYKTSRPEPSTPPGSAPDGVKVFTKQREVRQQRPAYFRGVHKRSTRWNACTGPRLKGHTCGPELAAVGSVTRTPLALAHLRRSDSRGRSSRAGLCGGTARPDRAGSQSPSAGSTILVARTLSASRVDDARTPRSSRT